MVVASYEAFEVNERAMLHKLEAFAGIRGDVKTNQVLRNRPTAGLASEMPKLTNQPWKSLVLDEAHLVNKWESKRHQAIT